MSKLEYNQNQELMIDGVRLKEILGEGFRQGFYYYSRSALRERIHLFKTELQKNLGKNISIHYAMKANPNKEILSEIRAQGLGVDIVSGGEFTHALNCGFKAQDIVFSGVAKSHQEIEMALQAKLGQFNVESPSELHRILKIAQKLKTPASVVLRVNPNVDAKTHPYIATGIAENKFGLNESQYQECLWLLRDHDQIEFKGLSCHIGSQILDVSVYKESLAFERRLFQEAKSLGFKLEIFNIGGGLGINYSENGDTDRERLIEYAQLIGQDLKGVEARTQFEPGRFLVARCGFLLTQIEYLKNGENKSFVLCNSGMNHLLRPALYGAKHRIFPVIKRSGEIKKYDVVGPVCESSDFLGKDVELPPCQEGDWLCVCDVGAYGASMASQYNLFGLPQEVCQ